jgi:hypothetical protein
LIHRLNAMIEVRHLFPPTRQRVFPKPQRHPLFLYLEQLY